MMTAIPWNRISSLICMCFSRSGRVIAIINFPQRTDEFPASLEAQDFGPSYFAGTYVNCATAVRRSVFVDLGGYPDFSSTPMTSRIYLLRCLAAGWQVWV